METFLADTNLHCVWVSDLGKVRETHTEHAPELAIVDGNLGKNEVLATCRDLRDMAGTDKLAILVLISEMDDASLAAVLATGADDFIGRNIKPLSFKSRVLANLSRIGAMTTLASRIHDSKLLIEITSSLVISTNILDNLHNVALLISEELSVDRCSIVLVRPQGDFGLVVSSSDDPTVRGLAINLQQYPEIAQTMKQSLPLIIEDVDQEAILEPVIPKVKEAGVAAMALFPIIRQAETVGVMFLRYSQKTKDFDARKAVFCQTVANAASIAMHNVEILELLKEKTREVEKVQTEARDQLRILKRYEDFFLSGFDGNVVIKQSGDVVFANPVASEMMGQDVSRMKGNPFDRFLLAEERASFQNLLDEFVRGETRRQVDFRIMQKGETDRVITVSAGSMFGEEGLMLLTMRDVTTERMLEQRLVEARERLIQGEKQAAMAELAGAAAHELNQPLTSVMTSLAMLRRLGRDELKRKHVIDTMEQESERMALIIRSLTQITSYSTKNYVGKAKIVDLDIASLEKPATPGKEKKDEND
ncbi:MAG: PAS domain S-box protein [Proteobacteria bacterium]|nr:PAS domain S-box protein [Pseudomonadota bacterium]